MITASISSLGLPLALLAQSGTQVTDEVRTQRSPVAVSVTASARIIRPTVIRIDLDEDTRDTGAREPAPQRSRDAAGTLWIEFS